MNFRPASLSKNGVLAWINLTWGKSSSSLINSEDTTTDDDNACQVKDAIEALRQAMEAGFSDLRSDMDKLGCEFTSDIEKFDRQIKELRHSLRCTQEDAALLKKQAEKNFTETNAELEALRSKIANLELRLNEEREDNIILDKYTRRENLRFNNISKIRAKKIARCSFPILSTTFWKLIPTAFDSMLSTEWV